MSFLKTASFVGFIFNVLNPICFAVDDSNNIDFSDNYYAEILKSSVNEVYLTENGKIPTDIRNRFQDQICQEAISVKRDYSNMTTQWSDPNQSPSSYKIAAEKILSHIELNEKKALTFGTVVRVLGLPDRVSFLSYEFDDEGIVLSERFVIHYEKKEIDIKFSAMGFCRAVDVSSSVMNTNVIRWPQKFSYWKQRPILCNLKLKDESYISLCSEIDSMIKQKSEEYKNKFNEFYHESDVKLEVHVMLIDQVTDDLAIVFLKVLEKDGTFYYDTWWGYQANNWRMLNEEQVSNYFVSQVGWVTPTLIKIRKTYPEYNRMDSFILNFAL